jgi:hypothetical protein
MIQLQIKRARLMSTLLRKLFKVPDIQTYLENKRLTLPGREYRHE